MGLIHELAQSPQNSGDNKHKIFGLVALGTLVVPYRDIAILLLRYPMSRDTFKRRVALPQNGAITPLGNYFHTNTSVRYPILQRVAQYLCDTPLNKHGRVLRYYRYKYRAIWKVSLLGLFALGTTPGYKPRFSPYFTQWKPSLSLRQYCGRRAAERAYVLKVYVCDPSGHGEEPNLLNC